MNHDVSSHVKKHFRSLKKINKTRMYDLLEVFKNSMITFFVTLFVTRSITKCFLYATNMNVVEFRDYVENAPIWTVIFHLSLELSVFSVIFYYLEKIIKFVPPIPMLFDSSYKLKKRTVGIAIELIMIVLLFEFSPTIKIKIERIYGYLSA